MSDKKVLVKYSMYTKGMQPEFISVSSTIPESPLEVLNKLAHNSSIDNTGNEINSYVFNISFEEVE